MSDEIPSSRETFESQKESLAEAWDADYQKEEEQYAMRWILTKNTVRLAQRAVLERARNISEK